MVYKCYILPIGRLYHVHQNLPRISFRSSSEIGIVHRSSPAPNFGHLFMLNLNLLVGGDVDVHCHAGRIDFFAILKSHRIQPGKGYLSLPIFISPVVAIQRSRKGETDFWDFEKLVICLVLSCFWKNASKKNFLPAEKKLSWKLVYFQMAGDFPIRESRNLLFKMLETFRFRKKARKFCPDFLGESFLFTSGCPWKWS